MDARQQNYSTIQVAGEEAAPQTTHNQYALVAVMAGAALMAFGGVTMATSQQSAGSLYSTVGVRPAVGSSIAARPVFNGRTQSMNQQFAGAAAAGAQQGAPLMAGRQQTAESTFSAPQGGLVALVGVVMAAFGAIFAKTQKKPEPWAMAALAEPETTLEDMLLARQTFLAKQGMGVAPREEPRATTFPGSDEPVDLEEMYKSFEELLGENVTNFVAGNRVTGTIYDIDDKGASVDFGGKEIGYCPLEELAMCKVKNARDVLAKGDEREFEIIATGATRKEGEVTYLSLKRIGLEVAWKRLAQYRENEVTFTCTLRGKNRGGYLMEVTDLGVPGFLPRSQASSDLATANENADPSTYMDKVVDVKILDIDQERRRLVVSQRAAAPKMSAESFKVGTVHEGVVQNVKPYGAFVDVGGMSGLLHISQISHARIDNVETVFTTGDKIKCMVLSQDPVQGRLSLSTKRLEPTHGDMLTNPDLVYEKAEEMAERFREDIAAAEKRMQEFEKRLTEQNEVAF